MKRFLLLLVFTLAYDFIFAQAPTNGLVAYYPFNGDAQDAVGSNHGAVNGAILTTNRNGIANSAFYFDGNDWIKILQSPQFEFNDYTLSVWFKPQTNSLGLFLANPGATQSDDYWTLGIYGNQIEAYVYSNKWLRGNNINIDQWQNVIFTKSGTIGKIFINGVLTNTFNDLANNINYSSPRSILIGGDDDQGNDGNADTHWYNGSLDDIRIYNRDLTDSEVQALYQAEAPPIDISTGLVAHYKMDGNAQDASGNSNHGTQQGGVNFNGMDRFGVAGKAAGFDGIDDKISILHNSKINLTNNFSITGWLKTSDKQENTIIQKGVSPNYKLTYWGSINYNNNQKYFDMNGVSINNLCNCLNANGIQTPINSFQNNVWTHISFTLSDAKFKYYENGVLINQVDQHEYISDWITNSENLIIGTSLYDDVYSGGGIIERAFFQGILDDIRIYTRALSDAEVAALYASENSSVSLTTAMRFGGGQTILNLSTAYNVTASIKNNGSSSWVGDVYLKVKNGTPMLISSNNVISAGGTYNINSTFTPQTAQIGTSVTMELLTKQGTNDFVRVATVNGTVNPVKVNIEALSNIPEIREPFISLSSQEVEPGQTVVLIGGNFTPNQALNIEVFPTISGFSYTGFTVAADGSFSTTLSFPASTKEDNVTINVSDGQGKGAGKILIIAQSEDVAELKITKPSVAGQQILIQPQGYVPIEFSDKLIPKSNYPLENSSRSFRYEIGFRYGGGTVDFPILTTELKKGFVNNKIQESYLVKMDAFSTISSPEGWPIQFYVKDFYDNSRKVYSPTINLVIVNQLSKVDLKWDASMPFEPVSAPKGIAADGTSRMYLLAEKVSAGGSPIANLAVQLSAYESNQDNDLNNTAWLGKVMYATDQSTINYTEEANSANSTVAVKLSPNANGKYYFWYVAPDDFTVPGIPALYSLDNSNERTVFAKFTITYADNTTEILTKEILVIRPPLMLVHGLSGDEHSWDKFKLKDESLWKISPRAVRMLPDAKFIDNGLGLVNHWTQWQGISNESSFQSLLTKYRFDGWVTNRVDYVCHSMGGAMLRALIQEFPDYFYVGAQSTEKTKNYGKGYVNKFITINTPHNGSPLADLLTFTVPHLPIYFKKLLSANEDNKTLGWSRISVNWFDSFLKRDFSKNANDGYYEFKSSDAVRNLMTNQYGIYPDGYRFKETNLKSHMIGSDMFFGNLLPTDKLMQQLLLIEATTRGGLLLASLNSVGTQYKSILKLGTANAYKLGDYYNTLKFISKGYGVASGLWNTFEANNIDKLVKIDNKLFNVGGDFFSLFGNWNKKYPDFLYNSDWIVPTLSQIANKIDGYNDNVTVITNIEVESVDKIMNNIRLNHVNITDIPETSFGVKKLLNSSINSTLFDKIPANNNPVPQVYVPPTNSNLNNITQNTEKGISSEKNIVSNNIPEKPLIERFNRNKVIITSPFANSTFENSDNIMVKVNISDTVKLVSCKVVVGNDLKDLEHRSYNYSFVMKPTLIPNLKNFVLAAATYSYPDSVVIIYDSLSVNATTYEQPIKLIAKPKNYEIGVGQQFTPSLVLVYPSFIRSPISDNDLSVVVENSNSLEWNGDLKVFIGKKPGESKVVFSYQGLKDSVFVMIDKGGISPSNALTTSAINTQSVCQGGVISVPYSYSGTFENDNAFLIQLAPEKSLDFQTLSNLGNGNPQIVRLPNNTPAGSGYQIRAVSTNVPIIGSKSPSTITVTAFETPPVVTTNKSEFKLGETVILSATGCNHTIKWSTGQTGNSITISPTESGIYKATCTNFTCESSDSEPIIINKYLCVPSVIKTGETTVGVNLELAGSSISSTEKIKGIGTKMTYEAPTITLNPGFGTETGVVFKVQIGGCN